jgi:hypothetical protein
MFTPYEIETIARTRREDIAREIAANRRANEATRKQTTPSAWRRQIAATIRAAAAWIAPAATEPVAEPEPRIS